ncbi:uncharacterized protein SPSC_03774 [Sporisorium scitamineum]|uniref:Secreted protein n=1 Tax=Sporisorium scitamineum TaxID=49012 RepID=A0A127ZG23_9BASI|nr:uncharacterized protein SPSC_03774 [Sporisorium scitamineum]
MAVMLLLLSQTILLLFDLTLLGAAWHSCRSAYDHHAIRVVRLKKVELGQEPPRTGVESNHILRYTAGLSPMQCVISISTSQVASRLDQTDWWQDMLCRPLDNLHPGSPLKGAVSSVAGLRSIPTRGRRRIPDELIHTGFNLIFHAFSF